MERYSIEQIVGKFFNGNINELEELYYQFVEDWQDEYGPCPEDYVPGFDSNDFKIWLDSVCQFER